MDKYIFDGSEKICISKLSTKPDGSHSDKKENKKAVKMNIKKMIELQDKLYAQNDYSLLLVFQAMDAAGKDGMIKSVTSGLNPQGTQVFSFKQPSKEELDHDYLWRAHKAMPERGRVGVFNRSYYEDVLVTRVHELTHNSNLPKEILSENIWNKRLVDIKNFEDHMTNNGQVTLKFFLNVGKEEQKSRFLERVNNPAKNWKFSSADIHERQFWNKYMFCYEQAIDHTSTPDNPWHVIPADDKWYARKVVSDIIVERLSRLDLAYPTLSDSEISKLEEYKQILLDEEN